MKGNETRLALIVQVSVFNRFVCYRSQKLFPHSLILKRRLVWFSFFKVMHAYIGIPTNKYTLQYEPYYKPYLQENSSLFSELKPETF